MPVRVGNETKQAARAAETRVAAVLTRLDRLEASRLQREVRLRFELEP